MQLNTGQWVVMIVAAVLIAGYGFGYYYNRRRAEHIYAWLRSGLSTLGTVTTGEKLPGMASGGRLEVNQAAPPLKRVEAVYLLAPRENIIFWLFHLLQGRSDELIVWVTYQDKPEQSVEVAHRGDRQLAKRLAATDKVKLVTLGQAGTLQVAAEEVHGALLAGKVQGFIEAYKADLTRLAIRPEKPHLFLRMKLGKMMAAPAEQFFATLKELVR